MMVMAGGRLGLDDTSHCTEMMPGSGTQNTVGHKGRWQGQDGNGSGENADGIWGSISPQRQEGCTTKAVDTGTEKGH